MQLAASSPRRTAMRRILRYGSVSAISTVTSLTILGILVGAFGFSALWSNVIATAIGTIPSFELNRRWVWSQSSPRSLWRQALPYCTLSFVGLIVSSVAVHVAGDATNNSTRVVHTAAVEIANFGAYGALWLLQFVLCDRVLFASRADTSGEDPAPHAEVPLAVAVGVPQPAGKA